MDGHGGSLISTFVSANFLNLLLNMKSYKDGLYEQALIETFLKFDELLRIKKVNKFLKQCMGEHINKQEMKCWFFNPRDIPQISYQNEFSSSDESTKNNSGSSKKAMDNLVQLIQSDKIINLKKNEIMKQKDETLNIKKSLINQRTFSYNMPKKKEDLNLKKRNSKSLSNAISFNVDDLISKEIGTTANVLLIKSNFLYLANVGDSRSFMYKNKKAIPLNLEHKIKLQTEYNRIIKSGSYIMNNRIEGKLNLTRAIGDLNFKKNPNLKFYEQAVIAYPEITKVPLTKDIEFIIMGCDGLWDCVEPQKLCEFVSDKLRDNISINCIIEEIFHKIISPTNDTPIGTDNVTCIIIKFK